MSFLKNQLNFESKVNPNIFETLSYFNRWVEKNVPSKKRDNFNLYDIFILNSYCFPDISGEKLVGFSQIIALLLVCDGLLIEHVDSHDKATEFVEKASDKANSSNVSCSLGLQAFKMLSEGNFYIFILCNYMFTCGGIY